MCCKEETPTSRMRPAVPPSVLRFTPRAVAVKRTLSSVSLASAVSAAPAGGAADLPAACSAQPTQVLVTAVPEAVDAPLHAVCSSVVLPDVNTASVVPADSGEFSDDSSDSMSERTLKKARGNGTTSESSLPSGVCSFDGIPYFVPSSCVDDAWSSPLFRERPSSSVSSSSASSVDAEPQAPAAPKVPAIDDMFCGDVLPVLPCSPSHSTHAGSALPPMTAALPAGLEPQDGWDDGDGYYLASIGEMMAGRYRVLEVVGRGMFSCVLRAVDTSTSTNARVAIKVIRANDMMMRAAEKEAALLQTLAARDPDNRKRCVRLLGQFSHRRHTCLVFESLEMDLRKLNKQVGGGVGLSFQAV